MLRVVGSQAGKANMVAKIAAEKAKIKDLPIPKEDPDKVRRSALT